MKSIIEGGSLLFEELSKLFCKFSDKFSILASQFHEFVGTMMSIFDDTKIFNMNIFKKFSNAFFDRRVFYTFDILNWDYFLISCITAVHTDELFFTLAYEHFFIMRLNPIFSILSKEVSLF